ncbi:MAG: c-type cytochrome [Casimicrobiaceae bacterium]
MRIAATTLAVAALAVASVASAQSAEDLLKKNGCTACHAIDKKVVGPAYKDVAVKYAKEPRDAVTARLSDKVKKGGSGVWGPVPMPPNAQVNDADIKTMVVYILDLNKGGAPAKK